ncbi:Signal transduction histidine kinase [Halopseudomonas xinjiangensis]|uniref:histidine kinase n=1 Tax=Halopseudomonas xinjiangensis TaxID=487184 RepID=A0A1H1QZV8_9GAMM|nr:CHASE3 domain-containing protein [Halopseudomonas xinjiangensis]SDS28309.1 Signal transduction histidine kinase [Halopseudomonas xinjiangensis]
MRVSSKLSLHLLAFLLGFSVLLLLAWQGARTQRSLLDANESVQHSLELITAAREMFSSIQDIETGERGYVITGVERYLEPYLAAQARLAERRRKLGQLLAMSGAPRPGWIGDLDRLVDRKLDISDANIEARMDSGLAGAADRLLGAGGKDAMDQLRRLFAELQSSERAKLAAQNRAVDARVHQARWIAWIGGLFAACLFCWAIWLVDRSQKRVDDQRLFLRSVVDADDNYIFVTDSRRRLLLCNEAFAGLSRSRPDALQGEGVEDLPQFDTLSPLFEGDAELLEGKPELRIAELDLFIGGRQICLQICKRAFELSAGHRLVLTVAVDISLRREMERMKNEFISTVSHELRTPLTAIRGALGMLVSGTLGTVDEQQKLLLDIAHKNSERLVRLVNDILDIEKLASGRLAFNLSPQPLLPLINNSLSTNLPYAREFDVTLQLEAPGADPGTVLVDADRFAQVMANLLSNAIKHSPRGGLVTVTVDESEDSVQIGVVDRGPGVPEEFRGRIFERFAQADSSNVRRLGGTGLGLAITRSLVEQMHGSIGFESEPDKGARFFVRLPHANSQVTVATPQPLEQEPSTQNVRSVLVLEPDDSAADFLLTMLAHQGYEVIRARSAGEARELLTHGPVHALTLSPTLRDEDCIAFLQNLREQARFRHLPILVVSVDPSQESGDRQGVMRGSAVGVMDWLNKPIDPMRVLDVVKAILRPAGGRPSILHVEDDTDLRTLLANLLAPLDVDVVGVGSLAEAREALTRSHHDLAILDLMLPDGDGSELIGELAKASPPTPVIIFSALDSPVAESRLVLKRLVKSRHESDELASLIQQLLHHWPAVDAAARNEGTP